MSRVCVTGGTGVLGKALRPLLLADGHTVRVMSRRGPRQGEAEGIEWAQAQLDAGEGLAEALAGVDVIIHAATSPFKRQVDVDGTRLLLESARAAGVSHFIYISIVGIDQIPMRYYKYKLAAEELIQVAGVPWSILRATQFHELIDRLISALTRLPLALIPADFRFQTISASETSEQLARAVSDGPGEWLPDIGGPEVLTLGDMTRAWLMARGMHRRLARLPMPGKVAAGFRRGLNTTPDNRIGRITWAAWLEERYGKPAHTEEGTWQHQPASQRLTGR